MSNDYRQRQRSTWLLPRSNKFRISGLEIERRNLIFLAVLGLAIFQEPSEPICGGFRVPGEPILVVNIHQSKALRITLSPLEVVQERPSEVPSHISSISVAFDKDSVSLKEGPIRRKIVIRNIASFQDHYRETKYSASFQVFPKLFENASYVFPNNGEWSKLKQNI